MATIATTELYFWSWYNWKQRWEEKANLENSGGIRLGQELTLGTYL